MKTFRVFALTLAWSAGLVLCGCDADESNESTCGRGQRDSGCGSKTAGELAWGPIERIMDGGSGAAAVLAPNGTATALWTSGDGKVFSREAPSGQVWAAPQEVSDTGDIDLLTADGDEQGTVTAVWTTETDTRYTVWSAEHPVGGPWAKPVKLGGGSSEDIGLEDWDLAVGLSGAAVLAWADADDGRFRVTYRATSGGAWSQPKVLPGYHVSTPTAIVDSDGRATVAYLSGNGEQQLTFLEGSAQGWRTPVELPTRGGPSGFDIEAGLNGEVVVAWQGPQHLLLTSRLIAGRLSTPRAVFKDPQPAASIDMAVAPDGSVDFVWISAQRAAPGELHGVEMAASGTLGGVQVIGQSDYCRPAESTAIVEDNERGDTLVAWNSRPSGLRVAHRDREAERWEPQEGVVPEGHGPNCGYTLYGNTGTLAVADDGSVLTTWIDSHSSPTGYGRVLLARRATLTK